MAARLYFAIGTAMVAVVAAPVPRVIAQESGPAVAQANEEIEEVRVVGSRRLDRSAADSPVPVDVVQGADFQAHGDSNMDTLIASLVPSYNVGQEPISDAATFIRPATLRGLAPEPRSCSSTVSAATAPP